MARTVSEIMNAELFAVRGRETVAEAVASIIALEITAVPVLDDDGRPIGMVELRGLLEAPPNLSARRCLARDAAPVPADLPIEAAGRAMAQSGQHHLVVVDEAGRAVGIVSTLDVLRGLFGVPISRSTAFPHFDADAGVSFSDDLPVDAGHALTAPDEPGVLVLIHGGPGRTERVVSARACDNLRQRVGALAMNGCAEDKNLLGALRHGQLRFRTAKVADPSERERVVALVLARAMAELRAGAVASA